MTKSILVTGGAGFIGSHLVDGLIYKGHKVTVVDDLSNGNVENINKKAQFLKADITSQEFVDEFKKLKPDAVFHLAAQSSIKRSQDNPHRDIQVNLISIQNLVDAAKASSVQKIIFASSAAVYGSTNKIPINENASKEPISFYGTSKLCSEFIVRNSKIKSTILRFANVYGPRQGSGAEGGVVAIFIDRIIKNKPVMIFGDGQQTRDFIYVSDVTDACIKALESNVAGEFNIGTTTQTSVSALHKKLLQLSGSNVKKLLKPLLYLEVKRSALSYQKFNGVTGWKPTISLDLGLKRTIDHFRSLP